MIRDNLPSELRFQLLRKYTRSHKLDKRKDAKRIAAYRKFLENPNFSPREIAYIANSLKRFSAAANLSTAIAQLGAIDNVADAMFIAGQYELLDVLHKRQSPIKKLLLLGNKIGAMNEAGNIVVPSTLDVATSSADLKTSADKYCRRRAQIKPAQPLSTQSAHRRSVSQTRARKQGCRSGAICYSFPSSRQRKPRTSNFHQTCHEH